uniref:RNA methyltransferase n=1 Tax=Strongyloides venezuelensis TaxID=75913 RepID=A0A0K0FQ82_STRVS
MADEGNVPPLGGRNGGNVLFSGVTEADNLPSPLGGVNGRNVPTSNVKNEANNESKKTKVIFRYGNYKCYYGKRRANTIKSIDPRLELFPENFFKSKKVLDIGCNIGAVTLQIAKKFDPQMILGIDIDSYLIGVARKNIKHYCDKDTKIKNGYPASFFQEDGELRDDLGCDDKIFKINHFPDNVWFQQENYVLESDLHLEAVLPQYDIILALSITKWIHLNFGDGGMKRFFKRIFAHLNPGGKLVLEAQEFKGYSKKAKLDIDLTRNYTRIKFKPEEFREYLLSDEVGFERHEELGIPQTKDQGFKRVVEVFTKGIKPKNKRKRKIGDEDGESSYLKEEVKEVNPKIIKFHDSDED